MKTTAPVVCVMLAISIALQGCDLPWQGSNNKNKEKNPWQGHDVDVVLEKDATARCTDGHFSCDGIKEWCGKQMKRCKAEKEKDCSPTCTWKCQSPKCDQVCAPECNEPVCSTRCKGFNMESCEMQCGKPKCVVVCPKFLTCPSKQCAKCKTKCSEPVCNMICGRTSNLAARSARSRSANGNARSQQSAPSPSAKCSVSNLAIAWTTTW